MNNLAQPGSYAWWLGLDVVIDKKVKPYSAYMSFDKE